MAIAYPTNLKLPQVSGYKVSDNDKVRRNNVAVGAPRFELLTTDGFVNFIVNWVFSEDQFKLFDAWFVKDLMYGSKSFDLMLKVSTGLTFHECYFDRSYQSTLNGKLWKVSAKMIAVAKSTITDQEYQDLKQDIEFPPIGGGGGGGGSSYSFRTSVSQNNAIDFWTLDETTGVNALNRGKGAYEYTKESLVYSTPINPQTKTQSSVDSGTGKAFNIAGNPDNVLVGSTTQSGSVFSRSGSWGIEFALKFNSASVNDSIISFWDDAGTVNDQLFKIVVDPVDPDILILVINTTNDDIAFTNRSAVVVPSIAALGADWHYFSIFMDQYVSLICRVDDVEQSITDASLWESRLGRNHSTARFRVGAIVDNQVVNVFDGEIDEVTTYDCDTGYYFNPSRSFNWWKCSQHGTCPSDPILPPVNLWDGSTSQAKIFNPRKPEVYTTFPDAISKIAGGSKTRIIGGNKFAPDATSTGELLFFDLVSGVWVFDQATNAATTTQSQRYSNISSISSDGTRVIGTTVEDSPNNVFYHSLNGVTFDYEQTLNNSTTSFNTDSVSFSDTGEQLMISYATSLSPDSYNIDVYTRDSLINQWVLDVNQITTPVGSGGASVMSGDGLVIASTDNNGTITIYNRSSLTAVWTVFTTIVSDADRTFNLSYDGEYLSTTQILNNTTVWKRELAGYSLYFSLPDSRSFLSKMSGNGQVLVTTSIDKDGLFKVYENIGNGYVLTLNGVIDQWIGSGANDIDISDDGTMIILGYLAEFPANNDTGEIVVITAGL